MIQRREAISLLRKKNASEGRLLLEDKLPLVEGDQVLLGEDHLVFGRYFASASRDLLVLRRDLLLFRRDDHVLSHDHLVLCRDRELKIIGGDHRCQHSEALGHIVTTLNRTDAIPGRMPTLVYEGIRPFPDTSE